MLTSDRPPNKRSRRGELALLVDDAQEVHESLMERLGANAFEVVRAANALEIRSGLRRKMSSRGDKAPIITLRSDGYALRPQRNG
jgi:DNA-binding response OmpR family regulator